MRNLILLRGCPGVGKSYFLKKNDLDKYTICPDVLRLMFQTPVSDKNGKEGISQKNDRKVWGFVFELLEQRMARGEFTIVDATHSRSKLINRYRTLCKKYRYRCTVIDFKKPLKKILEQNKTRDDYKFVPEETIMMIHERLKSDNIPAWVEVLKPSQYKSNEKIIFDFTKSHKKILVFGDIHGCVEPLESYFKKNPYRKDYFYIFVGDYFDRGIQNVKVFKLIHKLMQEQNVLCLTGNHECHFFNYLNNEEIKSWEFKKTIKQFEEADISRKDIKYFYNRLGQFAYFKFYDRKFVITHGGIPKLPSIYNATQDYIKGIGKYEDADEVDKAFCKNTSKNCYSIHGHRNVFNEPIGNTKRTFNLCDKIEFGKYFRVIEITPKRIYQIMIKNNTWNEDLKTKSKFMKNNNLKLTNNEAINTLTKDYDILKKDLGNDIYSYNFKRKIFNNRRWTENTVKARGLFIDVKAEQIVARSYDKFFNWGERPETESKNMRDTLKFPVSAYKKENGFLGILSYYNGEWWIASKSTNQGEYAEYFKDIIKPYLTNKLKIYIEKNNVSFIFEVCDGINDPHIIDYGKNQDVILLDIIKNDFKGECLPYQELIKFGRQFSFWVKLKEYIFETWEELYKFKKEQDNKSKLEEHHEGWVFTDENNFRVKYKTPYYKFWKSIRALRDRIVKKGGDHTEIRNRLHSIEDFTVYNTMIKIPVNKLKNMNVIDIRRKIC